MDKLKERISKILGYTPYDEQIEALKELFCGSCNKPIRNKSKQRNKNVVRVHGKLYDRLINDAIIKEKMLEEREDE